MKSFIATCLAFIFYYAGNAQQPTKQQTFDYLRGKLLSLSTQDGSNGITETSFNDNNCTSTIFYEDKTYSIIFWGNLDANAIGWDIFDPNKGGGGNKFDRLIRIAIVAKTGYAARQLFSSNGQIDNTISNIHIRLLFSLSKAADIPSFQNKIEKAVKRLITLCGGEPERNLF